MSCVAVSEQQVTLALTDLTSEIPDKVSFPLVNHTGCGCHCKTTNYCKFDEGEMPDEENCRCIKDQTGSTAQGQGSDNEKGLCA